MQTEGGADAPPPSSLRSYQKKSEYNRRFGEPVPAFVITFVVALLTIALRIVVDEADGFACL